jgi:methionyl-tRNA formyltransferase
MTERTALVLGKGELAIRIAEWFRTSPEWDLRAVVPVVPEPQWADSLISWARTHEIGLVASGDCEDVATLLGDAWGIDLAFSVFYDRIIRESFTGRCDRILNLHNSPLPRYRGVSPINWALKNGEHEHGVTIHEIVPEVDAGPIVAQLRYSIYPSFDEVEHVYRRAQAYGWTLFEQTMPILAAIEPRAQVELDATHFTRIDDVRLGDRRGFTRASSGDAT